MASGIERDTRCIYRAPYHICMYIRPPTLITPHVTPTDSIYDACQLHVLYNVAVKSYIHVHGSIHNIPTGMYKWVHSDFNNFIINKCIQRDVLTFSQDLHILIVMHAFIYFNSHAHMSTYTHPNMYTQNSCIYVWRLCLAYATRGAIKVHVSICNTIQYQRTCIPINNVAI